MKHKQTVIDGEIVYANWFLRQGEAIWDFLYFHVLPIGLWYRLVALKDRFKYAMERAFTGFDRRISWGTDYTIHFYKRLLSDLYKHAHGWPGTASAMKEICPEEWAEVEKKWLEKVPKGKTLDDAFNEDFPGFDSEEYSKDGFRCWLKYIKRVLHYFEESDMKTCSLKSRQAELYGKIKTPFSESKRTVVERNGEYFYQYPSLGNSDEDNEQRLILQELSDIDEYRVRNLNLGMAEVAKNILWLCD